MWIELAERPPVRSAVRIRDGGASTTGSAARGCPPCATGIHRCRSRLRPPANARRPRRQPTSPATTRALAAEIAHRKQVEQRLRSAVRELRQAEAAERERARAHRASGPGSERDHPCQRAVHGRAGARSAHAAGRDRDGGAADEGARGRDDDGRNAKALGRMLASGERMSRMIEQLLDFTRLRVGGGNRHRPEERRPRRARAAGGRRAGGQLPRMPCRGHARSATPAGAWDADRLSQVLSNLVANALQHGVPAAGVRVFIDGRGADTVCVHVHNMGADAGGTAPPGLRSADRRPAAARPVAGPRAWACSSASGSRRRTAATSRSRRARRRARRSRCRCRVSRTARRRRSTWSDPGAEAGARDDDTPPARADEPGGDRAGSAARQRGALPPAGRRASRTTRSSCSIRAAGS